ncbi:MAG: hypothetical protein ACRBN8_37655 [Nannocystales bacterium]
MPRFPYYARLRPKRQAIYRRSDAITEVPLGPLADEPKTEAMLRGIEEGLTQDDRRGVQRETAALVRHLCDELEVPRVVLRVLARRPSDATAELHGLYEREEGKRPIIRVWMRTAAHERPVAYRTFVRVAMHELCHHLDYDKYALDDSMHTHGFFARESSLVRQLLGAPVPVEAEDDPQLGLFDV